MLIVEGVVFVVLGMEITTQRQRDVINTITSNTKNVLHVQDYARLPLTAIDVAAMACGQPGRDSFSDLFFLYL